MKINLAPRAGIITLHALIAGTLLLWPYFFSTGKNAYRVGNIPASLFTITGIINISIFYLHAYYLYPVFFNRLKWWIYLLASATLIVVSFHLKWLVLNNWYYDVVKEVSTYRFIFASSIGFFAFSFVYRLIIDNVRFEREQKERQASQLMSELKFLRSQISPHFLFNVLTNPVSLARKKSDKLEPSLIMLSDLLRYMLYDTQGKKVELSTEIEYLHSYLELQKLRFGNDVDIDSELEVSEEDKQLMLEPMLLIPFVENAFKHGVGYSGRPAISIRLSVSASVLTFHVRNKFETEPEGAKDDSSGIGLGNVVSRLNLLYKNQYTLTINGENNLFHIALTLRLS